MISGHSPDDPFRALLEVALAEFADELLNEAARLHRAAMKRPTESAAERGSFACVRVYEPRKQLQP